MKRKNIYIWCLIIGVISFCGFVIENIWLSAVHGCINNRNMIFPFLLGYGLAIFAIYMLFGTPTVPKLGKLRMDTGHVFLNILIFFGLAFVCVSVGELGLGLLVEKTCGFKWWNYARLPLHFTQYTSVPTSAAFAILIIIFLQFVIKPLCRLFGKMNERVLTAVAYVWLGLMVFDFLHSAIYMLVTHDTLRLWQISTVPLASLI